MTRRRSVLCVPASESRKVQKALDTRVDEILVDLEDAVAPDHKVAARAAVAALGSASAGPSLAVRVNAVGTPWHHDDLVTCLTTPAIDSLVVPKAEDPEVVVEIDRRASEAERDVERSTPLGIQLLIETPLGLHRAARLAACPRVTSLVLGYADLSAAMGRAIDASWQFAQDAVVLAARLSGRQAIDGPLLSIDDDANLARSAAAAAALGFDGKWVIHPAQVDTVAAAFTASEAELSEAREILSLMSRQRTLGQGAVQWRGRMIDEAVVQQARRTLNRDGGGE